MPVTALSVALEEDLTPLVGLLRQQGVDCQVYEEGGMQVLTVASVEVRDQVCELYERWRRGDVQISVQRAVEHPGAAAQSGSMATILLARPLTLLLIAGSVAGFLVFYVGALDLLQLLSYSAFDLVAGQLVFIPSEGQWWRALTPIFIHFGWLHIAFNSLWVWELGGRVEERLGTASLAVLALLVALGSNYAQFLVSGPSLFGGMSGVVYGLVGFCWISGVMRPEQGLGLQRTLLFFLLGWLVFCMVGPTWLLGAGSIANAAHVSGLLLGCGLAAVYWLLFGSRSTPV